MKDSHKALRDAIEHISNVAAPIVIPSISNTRKPCHWRWSMPGFFCNGTTPTPKPLRRPSRPC
jgi:hypothetical protein